MKQLILGGIGLLTAAVIVVPTFAAKCTCPPIQMINSKGEDIGNIVLQETPNGVLVSADLHGLPSGWHAFHIHQTGVCTTPDFKSAGGHFNPAGSHHGFLAENGPHAGDLPNVYVDESGTLKIQFLAESVTITEGPHSLLDADGSAIVMHEGADDYKTDPAGDAGGRIGCAAITQKK